VIISDHPIWIADALGQPAAALPDEEPTSLGHLARALETTWLVLVDRRGRYPEALVEGAGRACLAGGPVPLSGGADASGTGGDGASLFMLDPDCGAPAEPGA
jgi:hypothetical protein